MSIHGESEELLERGQRAQEHHDNAPTLHSLNGTSEQIGRDAFKVLQNSKPDHNTSRSVSRFDERLGCR